jgi:hypothetical protein
VNKIKKSLLILIFPSIALYIFTVGCNKSTKNAFVKGNINWSCGNRMFIADSAAFTSRSTESTILVAGFTSNKNAMYFTLRPATATGLYIIGPGNQVNNLTVSINGKEYHTNYTTSSVASTVNIKKLTNDNIAGTINGTMISDAGDTSIITGTFDVNF